MIEVCRSLVRESETVQLYVCDAADLSFLADRQLDVILFSFNGLDCVSPDQRLKVLGEVRKHLRDGGHFFFSSHNLNVFPFRLGLPAKGRVSRLRWLYRCFRKLEWFVKQKLVNRQVRAEAAKQRGWEMLADGEHRFGTRFYYVMPEYQVRQLEEAGFELVAVFNAEGKSIDWRSPSDESWLHYLCTPKAG